MKTLTIKQPFASLIVAGIKKYEFRSWKTNYRGELLIHAGKGIDKEAMKRFSKYNLEYPSGCIIAKVTLEDCILIDEEVKKELKRENELVYHNVINDDRKMYGFKISNIKKIDNIYINGQLGLWNYDKKI